MYCYVETLGCQMNKADSERILGLLSEIGYLPTTKQEQANLFVLNTCTIREGAADKALSYLGRWAKIKKAKANEEILIALAGCLAQERGEEIQKKMPFVDLVFGTHNLHCLPDLVNEVKAKKIKKCQIYQQPDFEVPETPIIRETSVTAWVNIILGCNFNCTYCIVPQVRGRERSRSPKLIRQEIEKLVQEGYKEVTLLGQNVTAYGLDLSDSQINLAYLLRYIHDIDGLERIRFLTGHPYHISDQLIETVAELKKACNYFHIPMQAGDNEVLRRMARVYTYEKYQKISQKIRKTMPTASITSDFIVGFPGETDQQFLNTCRAVQEIEFDSCITAMYSPRKNTPGALWEKDPALKVSEEKKRERINYLNSIVTEVALRRATEVYQNKIEQILIEKENQRNFKEWFGRTGGGKICTFPKDQEQKYQVGDLVNIKINQVNPWTLRGQITEASNN